MPLKKCSSDGKSGWKWGDSGHCYTGPGGKNKAIRQGVAIEGPDKFASKAVEEGWSDDFVQGELAEEPYDVRIAVSLAMAKQYGRTKTVTVQADSESEAVSKAKAGNSDWELRKVSRIGDSRQWKVTLGR